MDTLEKTLLMLGKIYPYIWPFAFIVMGFVSLSQSHIHFNVFGLDLDGHNLMWFMMGLAHADIFWRGWRARRTASN